MKPCAICSDVTAVRKLMDVPWRGSSETVLRCARCGLTYVEEARRVNRPFETRPGESVEDAWRRQFPDELDVHAVGAWGSTFQDTDDVTAWQSARAEASIPLLVTPGVRVVEVGCANGLLLKALRDRHPAAVLAGVEPSPSMAARVRAEGIEVHNGIIENAPWDDASIDAVIAFGSFIQMRDPNSGLAAVARLLKPGGLFLLDVPNDQSLVRALAVWVARFRSVFGLKSQSGLTATTLQKAYNPGRYYYYSRRTLGTLLSRHGLVLHQVTMRQPRYLKYGRHGLGKLAALAAGVVQRVERALGRENWLVVVAKREPTR